MTDRHTDTPGETDPRPVVRLPRAGLPGAAIAGGAAVAAVALFLVLDSQRRNTPGLADTATVERTNAFAPAPTLVVPPEARPTQPAVIVMQPEMALSSPPVAVPRDVPSPTLPVIVPVQPSLPALPLSTPTPAPRPPTDDTPALLIDGGFVRSGSEGGSLPSPQASGTPQQRPQGAQGASVDMTPARAAVLQNTSTVMATGTMIPAVLETSIDTARPGMVRAMVSQDARGFDGRRVLVPRGSRLIGEYQSDVRSGQNRVLITWTRLLRPDGVTIALGSPAADEMGGAGVPGKVHSFFFERFASALLQSALTVGVNLASRPANNSVIVGVPTNSFNNALGQGLLPGNDLRPKITVKQGAILNVFVARDLDFSGAAAVR